MSITDQLDAMTHELGMGLTHDMDRPGLTLAKVTNITDPDKFNRVKCLPVGSEEVKDSQGNPVSEETDWCYVMAPAGGPERGIFWFPQVDDLVVLAYLDGDPHRPLVIGALWTTEVQPPYTIEEGKVLEYSMRTPSKIEFLLHDEEEKHKATLTMPSGAVLLLDDENKKLELHDKDNKNLLSIDWENGNISLKADKDFTIEAGGNITIKAGGDIEITAGSSSIKLEQSGNLTIKGSAKVAIEGATLEEKGNTSVSVQGAKVEVKANATLDLNGSAMANLKGGMVKIN